MTFTGRAGAFRSTDSEAPPAPRAHADVLSKAAAIRSRWPDLKKADTETFAEVMALVTRLGSLDRNWERSPRRTGADLAQLFAVVWTVGQERALRAAYRAGQQQAAYLNGDFILGDDT